MRRLDDAERELGDFTEAQRAYERARDVAPSDPAVLNNLGVVYADLGRQTDAVATLTRALEASETAETRVNLADALSQMDRHAEALEQLRKATVLESRSADLWRRLGMTLFDQGDLEGAQRALETAVSLSHAPAAALELARVHLARKQLPEAASVQQQVRAAEPTNAEAAFALGRRSTNSATMRARLRPWSGICLSARDARVRGAAERRCESCSCISQRDTTTRMADRRIGIDGFDASRVETRRDALDPTAPRHQCSNG